MVYKSNRTNPRRYVCTNLNRWIMVMLLVKTLMMIQVSMVRHCLLLILSINTVILYVTVFQFIHIRSINRSAYLPRNETKSGSTVSKNLTQEEAPKVTDAPSVSNERSTEPRKITAPKTRDSHPSEMNHGSPNWPKADNPQTRDRPRPTIKEGIMPSIIYSVLNINLIN